MAGKRALSESDTEQERQWWKDIYLCGCEWDQYDEVFETVPWEFKNLESAVKSGGEIGSWPGKVYIFGSTEPQMVNVGKDPNDHSQDLLVQVPVYIAVLTHLPLSETVGVKSVMMTEEKFRPMREYRMGYRPLNLPGYEKRARGEDHGPELFALYSTQRRAVLSHLNSRLVCIQSPTRWNVSRLRKELLKVAETDEEWREEYQESKVKKMSKDELVKALMSLAGRDYQDCEKCGPCKQKMLHEQRKCKSNYCMPYIFLPHRQKEEDPSTAVNFFADVAKNSIPVEFDWEMDTLSDYLDEMEEEYSLDQEGRETLKELIKNSVRQAKSKIEERKQAREREISAISPEEMEKLKATKLLKFYPSNSSPDIKDIKTVYINRYLGKADQLV